MSGDHEWDAVLALGLEVDVHDGGFEDTQVQREFRNRRMQAYRRMQEQGLGHLWGAFKEGALVAKLGLFHVGELSRFQRQELDVLGAGDTMARAHEIAGAQVGR